MRRRVRSILLRVIVFLLLGAIVNVAVAWGCAYWSRPAYSDLAVVTNSDQSWHRNLLDAPPAVAIMEDWSGPGLDKQFAYEDARIWWRGAPTYNDAREDAALMNEVRWLDAAVEKLSSASIARIEAQERFMASREHRSKADALVVTDAGWPMRALRGCCVLEPTSTRWTGGWQPRILIGAMEIPRQIEGNSLPALLPYGPRWSGFAVNTVFYAVILWLFVCGAAALRWFVRRRRGLCPRCNYDLRGAVHDHCPECGARALPRLRSGRTSRRARSILTRAIVFLLLGAIVNVAVAWGLSCWSPLPQFGIGNRREMTLQELKSGVGPKPAGHAASFGMDEFDGRGDAPANADDSIGSWNRWVLLVGWPARCLYLEKHWVATYERLEWSWRGRPVDGIAVPDWVPWCDGGGKRALPTSPTWPGFAINTAFYAVILWLLVCGPFTLRRFVRRRRGRCVKCNYDLRGAQHDRCPECGCR